jgi:hypothetical protein
MILSFDRVELEFGLRFSEEKVYKIVVFDFLQAFFGLK